MGFRQRRDTKGNKTRVGNATVQSLGTPKAWAVHFAHGALSSSIPMSIALGTTTDAGLLLCTVLPPRHMLKRPWHCGKSLHQAASETMRHHNLQGMMLPTRTHARKNKSLGDQHPRSFSSNHLPLRPVLEVDIPSQ